MDVKRLLNDIYDNGTNRYCLQPVVVTKKTDGSYELIDGQQRLTSLFIILKYIKTLLPSAKIGFSLNYDTRSGSAEFLKNIGTNRNNEFIDFFYMSQAYETVVAWFNEKNDSLLAAVNLYKYLGENVYIIWYEVQHEGMDEEKVKQESINLFTRLNIGKIPLTSSELVKAMFLRGDKKENEALRRERQLELALQWDNIERQLHNETLWHFLTNQEGKKYQTRIDLILDMVAETNKDSRDKYSTFFYFDQLRNDPENLKGKWKRIFGGDESLLGDKPNRPLEMIWDIISQTFLILKDWFENHELYHKIGYLIAADAMTLKDIFQLAQGKTKPLFVQELDNAIKKSIKLKGEDANYAYLRYGSNNHEIKRLLLLFNVISVLKSDAETQWFPFDKYKATENGKPVWSLEHIHAQQSEGLKTEKQWKEWVDLHIPSIKRLQDREGKDLSELIEKMERAKNGITKKEFDEMNQEVYELLSPKGNNEYMHTIANLALLKTDDNAALNNSVFAVKRDIIIERDKNGCFIPFCTRKVFFKYYTPSDDHQILFWGKEDREAYIDAINKTLEDYLEPKINFKND